MICRECGIGITEDEDGLCWKCQDTQPWKAVDRGDFKHERAHQERVPKTVICIKCGGDKFIVGEDPGHYHGSLKCPTCSWERCFYDG